MEIKELRPLSKAELEDKLKDARKELMDLEFKRKIGVEKPHMFKVAKKSIARILTLIKEKQGEK